jgi:hypothetical protein
MDDKFYRQSEARRIADENNFLRTIAENQADLLKNQQDKTDLLKISREYFQEEHKRVTDERDESRLRLIEVVKDRADASDELRVSENKVALFQRERERLKEENEELELRIANQRGTLEIRDEQIRRLEDPETKKNAELWYNMYRLQLKHRQELERRLESLKPYGEN